MPVEIKFCGLTRASDAALGAALGAAYLGVVFARSPRRVDSEGAKAVFGSLGKGAHTPKKVGVFGPMSPVDIARIADPVGLDVIQMHGDPTAADVRALREVFDGQIWATRRIAGERVPADIAEIAAVADALLFDTRPSNGDTLGGTGVPFDWDVVAAELRKHAGATRIVLAGGLTPHNVARAVAVLQPAVVDVSSGVESAPGIKDAALMTDFVRAVGAAAE